MTKKHFNRLAHQFAMIEPENENDKLIWTSCIHAVLAVCQQVNPRFDRGRFLDACHFDYWKTHKIPA